MSAAVLGLALAVVVLSGAPSGAQIRSPSLDDAPYAAFAIGDSTYWAGLGSFEVQQPRELREHYRWNLTENAPLGVSAWNSFDPHYTIAFTVTAPGSYRLTVQSRILGEITRVPDALPLSCGEAHASVGAVTGTQTGGALASGALGFPALASLGAGNSMWAEEFDRSTTAVITGVSNGAPVAHTLSFGWESAAHSTSCDIAVRGGLCGGTTHCAVAGMDWWGTVKNSTAGDYPGQGVLARSADDDGHVVDIVLSYCGDGTVDDGEECDAGVQNGKESCCTSDCRIADAKVVCRPERGPCDRRELCTGRSASCGRDLLVPPGTPCRAAVGPCDAEEVCTGTSVECPVDQVQPAGAVCASDGNPCTVDRCDGVGTSCRHVPGNVGVACDDGRFCTVAETCQVDGTCGGGGLRDCGPANDPCHLLTCDRTADHCIAVPANDGAACDDDDPCTTGETCDGGACTAGAPVSCDDGRACTMDTCALPDGCAHHPVTYPDAREPLAPIATGDPCAGARVPARLTALRRTTSALLTRAEVTPGAKLRKLLKRALRKLSGAARSCRKACRSHRLPDACCTSMGDRLGQAEERVGCLMP